MREEARVVLLDRVGLIDEDLDDRMLAGSECRFRVRRGDDDDVDLAREQPSLGRGPVAGNLGDVQAAAGELLVLRRVGRQPARAGDHDHRLERSA